MDADSVSEVILFTTNDETLRNIAKHDETAGNCPPLSSFPLD